MLMLRAIAENVSRSVCCVVKRTPEAACPVESLGRFWGPDWLTLQNQLRESQRDRDTVPVSSGRCFSQSLTITGGQDALHERGRFPVGGMCTNAESEVQHPFLWMVRSLARGGIDLVRVAHTVRYPCLAVA